jgi:hypothetical protein
MLRRMCEPPEIAGQDRTVLVVVGKHPILLLGNEPTQPQPTLDRGFALWIGGRA